MIKRNSINIRLVSKNIIQVNGYDLYNNIYGNVLNYYDII